MPGIGRPALRNALARELSSGSKQERKSYNGTFVEDAFLGALKVVNALGAHDFVGASPSEIKMYLDVVANGRRDPITENDFSGEELVKFRNLVERASNVDGNWGSRFSRDNTLGHVQYSDYHALGDSAPRPQVLGRFHYEGKPDGSTLIKDEYDFQSENTGEKELYYADEDEHLKQAWPVIKEYAQNAVPRQITERRELPEVNFIQSDFVPDRRNHFWSDESQNTERLLEQLDGSSWGQTERGKGAIESIRYGWGSEKRPKNSQIPRPSLSLIDQIKLALEDPLVFAETIGQKAVPAGEGTPVRIHLKPRNSLLAY